MTLVRSSLVVLALALAAPHASAGTLVVMQRSEAGATAKPPAVTRIHLEADRARLETSGPQASVMIFRKDRDLVWLIDEREGRYVEMTPETMAEVGAETERQLAQARRMMEEALAKAPPEQRAMMEKMMAQNPAGHPAAGAATAPITYEKVASDTVRGRRCDRYRGTRDGAKVVELCVAEPASLDVPAAHAAVMRELADFYRRSTAKLGAAMRAPVQADRDLPPGLPIRRVEYRNGTAAEREEVVEIRAEAFAPTLFELPSGLRKDDSWAPRTPR